MVGVGRAATANQARLLGHRFDMLPIANATRRREGQHSLVNTYLRFLAALTGPRPLNQILLSSWNKICELCLECLLNLFSVGCSECVFIRDNLTSPGRGVFGAAKVVQLDYESFAQTGRGFRVER